MKFTSAILALLSAGAQAAKLEAQAGSTKNYLAQTEAKTQDPSELGHSQCIEMQREIEEEGGEWDLNCDALTMPTL